VVWQGTDKACWALELPSGVSFFCILTFGFTIGLGFVLEYWDFHNFMFWAGTQVSLSLAMNLVLLRTFYDWVFNCLSLLSCCFEIGGVPFWVGYVLIG